MLKKKQDDINAANKLAEDERKKVQAKKDADQKVIDDAETARLKKIDDDKKKRNQDAKALAEEEKLEAELLGLTEFEAEREKAKRDYEDKLARLEEFNISKEDLDKNYAATKAKILKDEVAAEEDAAKAKEIMM